MLLGDLPHEGETEPSAPASALSGARWPVECLEDAFAFILGYAWPTITDPDFYPSIPFADTNLDLAATVAPGVLQQIAEQSSQQVRITPQMSRFARELGPRAGTFLRQQREGCGSSEATWLD